ncbi:MAG: pyridoxamine 5'-phosphate oxidase [Rickettsiales bacterium]|nr:pyridoxamine 5'-phosphate oxidase [Rickettsiales bacterium]
MLQQHPITECLQWLEEAKEHPQINEPTAMSLATVDDLGQPSARIVLCKRIDEGGVVFYTNLNSAKSADIKQNPRVALCFFWEPLGKQVRIKGEAKPVPEEEASAYFASRPRGSQIGAWASEQSKVLEKPEVLREKITRLESTYEDLDIPKPKHWGGWRVVPESIEYWVAGDNRVHDRWIYEKMSEQWVRHWLYP